MKKITITLFLLNALLSLRFTLATEVSGEVNGIWGVNDSPYTVIENITLPVGEELTIESGVVVNFRQDLSFTVEGDLWMEGEDDDSIIFRTAPDNEFWGGIRALENSWIIMDYCFISGCQAGDEEEEVSGGALSAVRSEINIANSTFDNNSSSRYGGALYSDHTDLVIDNTRFIENSAVFGGALYYTDGAVSINNCLFIGNNSSIGGGAIVSHTDGANIENCQFLENTSERNGGAIYAYTDCRIFNCRFYRNTADGGGAIFTQSIIDEDCEISHNLFFENQAIGGGGICLNQLNTPTIIRNIFYCNSAERGGAVYIFGPQPDEFNTIFEFNTVVFNRAEYGGGICSLANHFSVWRMPNNIFWGNEAEEGREPNVEFSPWLGTINLSYCCIEGEWDEEFGDNLIFENPQLLSPEDHDFRLIEGSPCIDAGDPNAPRDPNGTRADIGARYYTGENPDVQRIRLNQGWQIISLNIEPETNDPRAIAHNLVARGSMQLIKDGLGRFYAPEFDFCNIPEWDVRQGYLIKMTEQDFLTVSGNRMEVDSPIQLIEGWNMAAYFGAEPMPPEEALESIRDHLIMVKDGEGHFWNVEFEFSNLEEMAPNCGYLIDVSEDCVLRYPE